MKRPALFTAAVATASLAVGFTIAPAQAQVAPAAAAAQTATSADSTSGENATPLYEQIKPLLPADYQSRLEAANKRLGLAPDFGRALFEPVINPDDYQCGDSALLTWLRKTVQELGTINALNGLAGMQMTTYYSLFFEPDGEPLTFGANGEYTKTLDHSFKDLKRFWDLPDGSQIKMVPMHGSILTDPNKVARVFKLLLGVTDVDAMNGGLAYQKVFNTPTFNFGKHPLLTLNSFASDAGEVNLPGVDPSPKIIMGDGISDVLGEFGLADVASQAILAHEFGHQVQYAYGQTQTDLTGPEASRRLELMADAYSAYYLTHSQGGHILWKRVADFEKAFAAIGDCSFTDGSHHGTPNQRMKAAEWGYHLAADAQRQGQVLSGEEFGKLFEAALPSLTAPDAG